MTFCAQRGAKHDDVLGDRAMQNEHGAHSAAGIIEHPRGVRENVVGMPVAQLINDGLDGVVQTAAEALAVLYGLGGDGGHFGGGKDVARIINKDKVE